MKLFIKKIIKERTVQPSTSITNPSGNRKPCVIPFSQAQHVARKLARMEEGIKHTLIEKQILSITRRLRINYTLSQTMNL